MPHSIPKPIRNETDLNVYEDYINEQSCEMTEQPSEKTENYATVPRRNMSMIPCENSYVPEVLSNTAFLPAFLTKQVGKLMRVELLLANRLEIRYGILMTVGSDYLVLRQYQSNALLTCDLSSVKFITIIPDNDFNKLMMK